MDNDKFMGIFDKKTSMPLIKRTIISMMKNKILLLKIKDNSKTQIWNDKDILVVTTNDDAVNFFYDYCYKDNNEPIDFTWLDWKRTFNRRTQELSSIDNYFTAFEAFKISPIDIDINDIERIVKTYDLDTFKNEFMNPVEKNQYEFWEKDPFFELFKWEKHYGFSWRKYADGEYFPDAMFKKVEYEYKQEQEKRKNIPYMVSPVFFPFCIF